MEITSDNPAGDFLSIYLQGVYIDKKYKFYVKISLIEDKNVVMSRKIYSSNNFKITDFSKEISFPVGGKSPNDYQILIQLKRYRGFGAKSKSDIYQQAEI